MRVRKPNHFKLALQLEEDAADPKHRPCHREKLLQAAARERELARKQDDLDGRRRGWYPDRDY